MIEPQQAPVRREASPWTVACITLLVALGSFQLVGPGIGFFVAYILYGDYSLNALQFITLFADPFDNEGLKVFYLVVQACGTFFGLAVIPPLFWKTMTHKPVFNLFKGRPLKPIHFLMVLGIVLLSFGLMSVLIEWNNNIDLPDGAFETWAKNIESQLVEVTKYITSFTNVGQYLFGVFVIAILAGIGEEIVFRGLVQPAFFKATGNIHAAIWISAIFFSAFHLQFYGFFPRVILGAMFGYLYFWSGNLWVPIFAHFVNNFFAVSSIYFGLNELPGMETENPEQAPWYVVLVMTAACGALIYYFYMQFQKTENKSIALDDFSS